MGLAKNHLNPKSKGHSKRGKAYRPTRPFRTVEGLESEAYKKLSRDAAWVLLEFYRKFNGYNQNELKLTYKEVEKKISTGTFTRSILELVGFGFIEIKKMGYLERNASVYGLSKLWKHRSKFPEKLNKIEKLIKWAEKVKRTSTPKNYSEENQKKFGVKRRRILRKIRKRIQKG